MAASVLAPMIGMVMGAVAFGSCAWFWRGWLLAHAELEALLTGAAIAALFGGVAVFKVSQVFGFMPG